MTDRRLLGSDSADDTGEPDVELAVALGSYGEGRRSYQEAFTALAKARLLVPVVAVLGEVEVDDAGRAHDKTSDMAAVLMHGADGRVALLAFTGIESMAGWDPAARPVPVPASTAALAAVQEGASALVIDVAGPVTFVVEDDALRALAST